MSGWFVRLFVSTGILLCGLALVLLRPHVSPYGTGRKGFTGAFEAFCQSVYLNPGKSAILAGAIILAFATWRLLRRR